ncbi:hypothetical protein [Sphingopyxis sp.]|uniref:hypothetical protein n=1 Tax=Sphingopyxis sp. TaxID=1908224 RepID=UPI002ED940BE
MQNIHRFAAPALIVAFALSACAATKQQTPLSEARNIGLDQPAYADGPVVKAVEVLEDSRCPEDVLCVHAGQLRLKMLWLRPGGREKAFEATLGKRTPLADGSILLEAVRPARNSGRTIKPEDYRFDFRFDGGF